MDGRRDGAENNNVHTDKYGRYKPSTAKKKKKKKITITFNRDGVLALLALLAITAAVVVVVILSVKAIIAAVDNSRSAQTTETPEYTSRMPEETENPPETTSPADEKKWNDSYTSVNVSNDRIHAGALILVNNEYKYIASGHESYTVLSSLEDWHKTFVLTLYRLSLDSTVIFPMCRMLADMKAENPDTLSGGDSLMISEALSENGEHTTGLAFNLRIFGADGQSYDLRAEEQKRIDGNCAEYGFVKRYPFGKSELTGMPEERGHFRYVGVPHAEIMNAQELCLEEYISYVKQFTYEGIPLMYTSDTASYLIYYVPAGNGGSTDIPVPPDGNYEISGNNTDGFIVTVTNK